MSLLAWLGDVARALLPLARTPKPCTRCGGRTCAGPRCNHLSWTEPTR